MIFDDEMDNGGEMPEEGMPEEEAKEEGMPETTEEGGEQM